VEDNPYFKIPKDPAMKIIEYSLKSKESPINVNE